MTRKKEPTWITVKEAARILTENSDHIVSENYVRRLGKLAKIETKQIDLRTKLYSEEDIKEYNVKLRGDGSVRRAVRKTTTKRTDKEVA